MATIESDADVYDDWSALAPSYQDVFLPRFQPMYDTIAHYVVKKIQSKDTNEEYKVLDYGTDQRQMLRNFFQQLKPNGLFISSHWPHPSQVPFLSILKRVAHFMATGQRIDTAHLESDASFICWPEDITKNKFIAENFKIERWITVDLPMSFPDIRTLLSFWRMDKWFTDSSLYLKAEKETIRILRQDFHLELKSNESFELLSKAIVVVACK
ncbi:unnamed protein product [Rotaria sp. Silwood1]|nr:unnamed protein product [Rotaria sp. Silwood1]